MGPKITLLQALLILQVLQILQLMQLLLYHCCITVTRFKHRARPNACIRGTQATILGAAATHDSLIFWVYEDLLKQHFRTSPTQGLHDL